MHSTRLPMSKMRLAIGRRMAESKQQAPHFYVSTDIPMDEVIAEIGDLNRHRDRDHRVTVTAALACAAAAALRLYPDFNAVWGGDGPERVDEVNLAIAIALDDGLIAPAILGAGDLSLDAMATRLRDLVERARSGRLRTAELIDGTFTLSNLGTRDVSAFTAIITPPQVAVLAVGRVSERAWVVGDRVEIRKVMTATLSADHRVVDGVAAAKFLEAFKGALDAAPRPR